jgi:hypothetical protein
MNAEHELPGCSLERIDMAFLRQCLWELRALSDERHGHDPRPAEPASEAQVRADIGVQPSLESHCALTLASWHDQTGTVIVPVDH